MTDGPTSDNEILFAGVRVFDGVSDALSEPVDVLVRGVTIAAVTSGDVVLARGGLQHHAPI